MTNLNKQLKFERFLGGVGVCSDRSIVRILMVARWPLGGIRTYMKYVCRHLPSHFMITLLAASTQEDEALREDVATLGVRLIILPEVPGMFGMALGIRQELSRDRYDVILSQGFISAVNVVLVNPMYRVPHVLTVHGIIEEKYISGKFGFLKRFLLSCMLSKVDVLYAVSNDMLSHVQEQLPALRSTKYRKVVIPNGVDVETYVAGDDTGYSFRRSLGIGENVFLFGFLGRFMLQKGFNYLVDAVEMIEMQPQGVSNYLVLAVGSGDYLEYYQSDIQKRNLEHRFKFVPFMNNVSKLYPELNAVVMPSIWEASGLLAMEALVSGTPLIVSDSIGLRETVKDTPAFVFTSTDAEALMKTMIKVIGEPARARFLEFAPKARERYDVRCTTEKLLNVIGGLIAEAR